MNPENLKWIDVSAMIKTHADLKPGDIFAPSREDRRPKGLELKQSHVHPDVPWDWPGLAVLRRWDRLDEKPYTVDLEYPVDLTAQFHRELVLVDGKLSREDQLRAACKEAIGRLMAENNWSWHEVKVIRIVEGHCFDEDLPEDK